MLLKSTGSLRRKRAENSPVWKDADKGQKTQVNDIPEQNQPIRALYRSIPLDICTHTHTVDGVFLFFFYLGQRV